MSEEEKKIWEDGFACDGGCGREVQFSSPEEHPKTDAAEICRLMGWAFLGEDEAYCPDCQDKSKRVAAELIRRSEIQETTARQGAKIAQQVAMLTGGR